jgi:hypothetical protein
LETIRAAKIDWARREFPTRESCPAFTAWKNLFEATFAALCTDPFDLFLQFLCWAELLEAARECTRCGVLLISDVAATDSLADLTGGVFMHSLFASGIMALDHRFTSVGKLEALFGRQVAHAVLSGYFARDGETWKPRQGRSRRSATLHFSSIRGRGRQSATGCTPSWTLRTSSSRIRASSISCRR